MFNIGNSVNHYHVQEFKEYDTERIINYVNKKGKIETKTIGFEDGKIDQEEYTYALNDLYDKFCEYKSDKFYKEWMKNHGKIDAPITEIEQFHEKITKAYLDFAR